jgi:hypothetical protein
MWNPPNPKGGCIQRYRLAQMVEEMAEFLYLDGCSVTQIVSPIWMQDTPQLLAEFVYLAHPGTKEPRKYVQSIENWSFQGLSQDRSY